MSRIAAEKKDKGMGMVLVFLAEGFEEIEALTAADLLRRADIDTVLVSVAADRTVTGSHGIAVTADQTFAEVDFDRAEMLVLPGGMPGTHNLEEHSGLMEKVDLFYQKGKMIAAICAAPAILGRRGMLNGREACSFPEHEMFLEGAAVSKLPAVIADTIITGRGMGCSVDFGLAIIEKLKGKEAAQEMAEKIVYSHYRK